MIWMSLRLRRGTDRDAVAVSALYLRARTAAKASIPMTVHTDDEVRRWIAECLRLWTFESNLGAQRFYERHGFRPIERTAGDNEEGAPDILYIWDAS
jgi:GNAT superfamily N-acetyltransferase